MITSEITQEQVVNILLPQNDEEKLLLKQPLIQEGLLWGEPRYGHPEGKVLFHVAEIFENIRTIVPDLNEDDHRKLRLIALVHDIFKFKEDKSVPRDWTKAHGILARQFMEGFTTDENLLNIIELHDEAYYCWKLKVQQQDLIGSAQRLAWLMGRISPALQLYYMFFKCDTWTGDKTHAPVKWFEEITVGINKIGFE